VDAEITSSEQIRQFIHSGLAAVLVAQSCARIKVARYKSKYERLEQRLILGIKRAVDIHKPIGSLFTFPPQRLGILPDASGIRMTPFRLFRDGTRSMLMITPVLS
jgi:hypothetical protein